MADQTGPQPTESRPTRQTSSYDEFGTAKRNLPPAAPVAIALAVVAIVIGIVAWTQRAKPAAQGSIDGAWFSQPTNMPDPMVLLEVTLRNVSEKPLYIKSIQAGIKTDQGDHSDDAASASDYGRYLQAYPNLAGHEPPLQVETKIPPGGEQRGTVLVTFPINQQQFDARKDLSVTVEPYDQRPIVLHEKGSVTK